MAKVWEPGMVVEGMRTWLIAQATPDPEEGDSPHAPAYLRSLQHLSELTGMFMEGYGFRAAEPVTPRERPAEPQHDEKCCMFGVRDGTGPDSDCPGHYGWIADGRGGLILDWAVHTAAKDR